MKWKRVAKWTAAGLGILIVVILVVGYLVLKSPEFHRYVLAKIMQQGEAATGGRLDVQNFDFHLSPLTVDLYGITLHGTEGPGERPLLQADKLTVSVSAGSLLHRKLQLTELLIRHPVAGVQVNKQGKNNFPQPPPKQSTSNTSVFDLAVGHTLLSNGEIYYNDKKSQLDANLYNLKTEVRFESSATRYKGSISYDNGRIQYANYPPFPHSLNARFSASPSKMSLDPLLLTVGSSRISLRADMTDFNNPKADGTYEIVLHTQDFSAMSPTAAPAGDIRLAGQIGYRNAPDKPLMRTLFLDGEVDSRELHVVSSQGHIQFRKLQGRYQLANGNLQTRDLAVDLLNGRLTADLSMQHLDTTPVSKVRVSLHGISLEAAKQSVNRPDIKVMPLTGTVQAEATASWVGSVSNIRALSDIAIQAAVRSNAANGPRTVPVDGTIHLNYDGPRNVITLRQTVIRIPSTSVVVEGQVSQHSNLTIQASSGDLHQLTILASSLRAAGSQPASNKFEISGSARLNAVMQGSMQQPRISAQLNAQNLQVQGSQWSSLQLALAANSSKVTIQNGSLVNARQGNLAFSAQVGLKQWSYQPSNPITATLSARRLSISDLEHLANVQYPITGILSADASFQGSQLNPAGHGSVQIARATAYNEPIQTLTLEFQAAGNSINSTVNVSLPAGSANAKLAYTPKTKAYNIQLSIPEIVLQKLQTVQAKNLQMTGTLSASASGAGTLDNPQLTATVQLPQLQMRQTTVAGLKAQLAVANQRANLTLNSNVAQAFIEAKANLNLTGDYYTEATIDTSKIPLDPLLAIYVPNRPNGFQGETELHATLKGPLKDKSRLDAHLTIPTLTASYQSLQIGNAGPIRADYANSVVVLQPSEIRGTDTSLRFQGRVPLQGTSAMNVNAQGSVDLRLLGIFSPDVKSSGVIAFDVRTAGATKKPTVQGQVQIKDVALSTTTAPVGLEKLNGRLDVTDDRVQITNLAGQVGGGQVSAGGSIAYRPSLAFNVALQGKSVRLLYPEGLRSVLDSNLTLTGNTQAADLNGRVLIDSLTFMPDFDLADFASQFSGASVPPSGQSFADNVKLGIAVQSAENLAARSSQVSLEGTANLQVIGTASNPVIVGRTDLVSGELFFMNNRYELQRGMITFDNPNQTTPTLNVVVTTTIQQYNLTLTLTGPIDKLRTSYLSDPPLASADIISLLYRGQTTEQAAAAGQSTDSILAGQAASRFSGSVQKLAGISSLQIDPLIGGNNTNPSARVAIQQRVTKNFLFTFSTDVSQPGNELVQGEYQLNNRWSVSVVRDQLGGVAVDGRYHTKF